MGGGDSMNISEVTTMISTLGFPIVMCLLMYKNNIEMADKHKQEMESVKDALNNNTIVLQKLIDKLDGE